MQKPIVQVVIIVIAAVALALVSNAIAGRERRLVLPGYYPSAQTVPPREAPPAPKLILPKQPLVVVMTPVTNTVPEPTTTTVTPAPAPKAVPVAKTETPHPASGHLLPAGGEKAPAMTFAPHPDKPYVEVGYDGAHALQSQGALILDARRTSVYEQGHIAGALPYAVWESDVDDKVNKLYAEKSDPREQLKPILVYCSGGDCEDSHMLAQKLYGVMFNNVYVYKDGFPDWQKRGGAIHTGSTP